MAPQPPSTFTLTAQGHTNIRASHRSTFEVTTDSHLTLRGDCIIGVKATHSARTLNALLGNLLRKPLCQIYTTLRVGTVSETIHGWGSPKLLLTASSSVVWRTSSHIDDRTIAVRCDKAAQDLDRRLVELMQNPKTSLQVELVIDCET
ncbi:MAG: DUF371 domain-containing protein [Candidatus Hodarchaeota archaeon]